MKLIVTIDLDRLAQYGNGETVDHLLQELPQRMRGEGAQGVIWTRNTANVGSWSRA
jgi:hypothetical protein